MEKTKWLDCNSHIHYRSMGPFRLRIEPDRRFATFTAASHLRHPKPIKKPTTRVGILIVPVADSLGLSPAGHGAFISTQTAHYLFLFTHCRTCNHTIACFKSINHIHRNKKHPTLGVFFISGGSMLALIEQKTNKNFLI